MAPTPMLADGLSRIRFGAPFETSVVDSWVRRLSYESAYRLVGMLVNIDRQRFAPATRKGERPLAPLPLAARAIEGALGVRLGIPVPGASDIEELAQEARRDGGERVDRDLGLRQ